MKKYAIFAIMVAAAMLIIASIYRLESDSYDAVSPLRGTAVSAVYAVGTVEASVMMPIASRSAAKLISLNNDEGDNVKKGDILAQLEDDDLKYSIKRLQAREEFAKEEYQRNLILFKKKAVSERAYEQAKADMQAAMAETLAAKAQADFLKLTAPDDGLIIKRDGEIGQMIPANQPVFWMSCCAPLRISAEVDEEDIAKVKTGQKVLIRADAFDGEVFKGKVQSITPKGDPIARSYRVRIEFTEENPLRIGMTAETNIIISENENALLIPSGALLKNSVWLVEDGKLSKKNVDVGARGMVQTEIKSGLTENDTIVLKPTLELEEGQNIRPKLIKWQVK